MNFYNIINELIHKLIKNKKNDLKIKSLTSKFYL